MRKSHWRDVLWFGLGTFFGGYVLGIFGKILGKA